MRHNLRFEALLGALSEASTLLGFTPARLSSLSCFKPASDCILEGFGSIWTQLCRWPAVTLHQSWSLTQASLQIDALQRKSIFWQKASPNDIQSQHCIKNPCVKNRGAWCFWCPYFKGCMWKWNLRNLATLAGLRNSNACEEAVSEWPTEFL